MLTSCAVKPTVKSEYNKECRIVQKEVKLSIEQIGSFKAFNCSNEQCMTQFLAQVAGSAVVFSVSALVSGSIAVVGNSIFWLDEQGECYNSKEANISLH